MHWIEPGFRVFKDMYTRWNDPLFAASTQLDRRRVGHRLVRSLGHCQFVLTIAESGVEKAAHAISSLEIYVVLRRWLTNRTTIKFSRTMLFV